jgi:hypothetical protein
MNQLVQLAMQAALPAQALGLLISDGTNASFSKTLTGFALNEVKGSDIASAATINLTTVTGNLVHVTGTTTITTITIPSGAERTVVFDGALTLTHNATTLILPTGANITTAAGDVMKVRGDGSGNARVVSYQRANGLSLVPGLAEIADITPTASATVDFLTTFTSDYDNYLIIGRGVSANAGDALMARFAAAGVTDSGNKYLSAATGSGESTEASGFSITGTLAAAGDTTSFFLHVFNANDATNVKSARCASVSRNASGSGIGQDYWATYDGANAITGIRFYWNTGSNFEAKGEIRVYAYSKAR